MKNKRKSERKEKKKKRGSKKGWSRKNKKITYRRRKLTKRQTKHLLNVRGQVEERNKPLMTVLQIMKDLH